MSKLSGFLGRLFHVHSWSQPVLVTTPGLPGGEGQSRFRQSCGCGAERHTDPEDLAVDQLDRAW